jgi:hypothetical protein
MYLMKTIAKTTVDEGNSTMYVEQRENYGNDNTRQWIMRELKM